MMRLIVLKRSFKFDLNIEIYCCLGLLFRFVNLILNYQ